MTPHTEKKLFLLDAYALIFRAYYAFIKNPRFNSKGLNTSAVLGFTNTLDEVLKKEKPTHIAVVFDLPEPTFRHKLDENYKAQRPPTPEDLIKAVPYIKQVIKGFNIPIVAVPGFEADDAIGTLAKQAEKEGFTVYMMTPDKDYAQLLSENISMFKPKSRGGGHTIFGLEDCLEKYQIEHPEQFIDILALWGDTADNIKGVPGIGEKTAIKLINKYKSIEGIYNNINELKGKQKENLENSIEVLKLSKTLVTIPLDVPTKFDAESFKLETPNFNELKEIFAELEFNALAKRILPNAPPPDFEAGSLFGGPATQNSSGDQEALTTNFDTIESIEHDYVLVDTFEKRKKLAEKLEKCDQFCIDTETTGVNPHEASLVGIAFSFKAHAAHYVPIPENKAGAEFIINDLRAALENPKSLKIGQNIKYDILIMQNHGVKVQGPLFDTMLAHYLLYPSLKHNMDIIAETEMNYSPVSIESLIGKKGKKQLSMRDISPEEVKEYAGEDADITLQLKHILYRKLKEEDLLKLAEEIEFPLIPVLVSMESSGIYMNADSLAEFEKELQTNIEKTVAQIHSIAGEEFNISSPKQLGVILFEKLKVSDKPKLTKTKQYSTSEQELSKLKDKHEIINLILSFRSNSKLLSTYVKALPLLISKETGRIHTSYNQAVATTGRLSSTNPNLQNIPVRTEEGKRIRKAFEPKDSNHTLLAVDYSQIELRLIAHLSQDEAMLAAFNNNEDIHTATAAKIYEIPEEEVTREMRSNAKSANFGIIYGISAFGLSENLGISRSEAKKLIDGYFKTYPSVKEYMTGNVNIAREKGYVETVFGRKRYLKDINSRNGIVRSAAERNAINAPVQGTAADIIKIAMIKCENVLKEKELKTKMILQVHDELVFDVPSDELEIVKKIIAEQMESSACLDVKLTVETGSGENWLIAH